MWRLESLVPQHSSSASRSMVMVICRLTQTWSVQYLWIQATPPLIGNLDATPPLIGNLDVEIEVFGPSAFQFPIQIQGYCDWRLVSQPMVICPVISPMACWVSSPSISIIGLSSHIPNGMLDLFPIHIHHWLECWTSSIHLHPYPSLVGRPWWLEMEFQRWGLLQLMTVSIGPTDGCFNVRSIGSLVSPWLKCYLTFQPIYGYELYI